MKARVRIIDGRQFVEVDPASLNGKYRDDRPHWERHDNRVWALVADVERLRNGNRGKA